VNATTGARAYCRSALAKIRVHVSCASLLTNFVNSNSVSSPFSGVEPCWAGGAG
jgi:hypothetical protein